MNKIASFERQRQVAAKNAKAYLALFKAFGDNYKKLQNETVQEALLHFYKMGYYTGMQDALKQKGGKL